LKHIHINNRKNTYTDHPMPAPLIHYSFEMRVAMLIKHLQCIDPCSSAQEAHDAVAAYWWLVHKDCGSSERHLDNLNRLRLDAAHGWKDLDKAVCYCDGHELPAMRIYLHRDGSIVIQSLDPANLRILFTLPGRRRLEPMAVCVRPAIAPLTLSPQ
jgi:hypothetical protein